MVFKALILFPCNTQLLRLQNPSAIDIANASLCRFSLSALFFFLLLSPLFSLTDPHHRRRDPFPSPPRPMCPRVVTRFCSRHGFSWRVSAFIIYPRTHCNYRWRWARTHSRFYCPCQIFLRVAPRATAAHVLFSTRCRCLVRAHFIRVHTRNVTIGLLFMLVVSHVQWRSARSNSS